MYQKPSGPGQSKGQQRLMDTQNLAYVAMRKSVDDKVGWRQKRLIPLCRMAIHASMLACSGWKPLSLSCIGRARHDKIGDGCSTTRTTTHAN